MPLPLSFYNNLVHQLHLLYMFFFSRKLVFFGVLCSLVIVLLGLNLTIWILGQVSFQFQHLHLFQMRLQLTSLFHETLLLDLVMSCAIVDTYLVTFWANSCSAVLGVGSHPSVPSPQAHPLRCLLRSVSGTEQQQWMSCLLIHSIVLWFVTHTEVVYSVQWKKRVTKTCCHYFFLLKSRNSWSLNLFLPRLVSDNIMDRTTFWGQ